MACAHPALQRSSSPLGRGRLHERALATRAQPAVKATSPRLERCRNLSRKETQMRVSIPPFIFSHCMCPASKHWWLPPQSKIVTAAQMVAHLSGRLSHLSLHVQQRASVSCRVDRFHNPVMSNWYRLLRSYPFCAVSRLQEFCRIRGHSCDWIISL